VNDVTPLERHTVHLLEARKRDPRIQRADAAAREVAKDRNATERAAVEQLFVRLKTLKESLAKRLITDTGSLTDFRRFNLQALTADVDRLIEDTQRDLAGDAKTAYSRMGDLGDAAAEEPVRAAQLQVRPELPGLDAALVTAAFDNTLELLTQPMQQFGSRAKVLLRGVTLAGDQKFEAIQKLRDHIQGAGFDGAQYRAERIIRTELGRTFNQAQFDRLVSLAADFPFLRKGWRAAQDRRTRLGHREAARQFARGQGIPIAALFELRVYDERPGKGGKLLGVARLRFPLDPLVKPEGRIGAAATIMCRCNAFVDFDLAEFAAFSAQTIQTSLQGVLPPAAPKPAPLPAPTPAPKPRKPRAVKPAPVQPKPAAPPTATIGGATDGPMVSAALKLPAGKKWDWARKAMAGLDRVHSDGVLDDLPLKASSAQTYLGAYSFRFNKGKSIALSGRALQQHPYNTLYHETGHWLDHLAVKDPNAAPKDKVLAKYRFTTQLTGKGRDPLVAEWHEAVSNSPTIRTLGRWALRTEGSPMGIDTGHLRYLLRSDEVWARSYAQYVALRSGDANALAELRMMQKGVKRATEGGITADTRMNTKPLGPVEPDPDSWDYPIVWQDDEFEPIAAAFDRLFEKLGWRKS
jgi:hypothetical protein